MSQHQILGDRGMGPPSSSPLFFLTYSTLLIPEALRGGSSGKDRARGQSGTVFSQFL